MKIHIEQKINNNNNILSVIGFRGCKAYADLRLFLIDRRLNKKHIEPKQQQHIRYNDTSRGRASLVIAGSFKHPSTGMIYMYIL